MDAETAPKAAATTDEPKLASATSSVTTVSISNGKDTLGYYYAPSAVPSSDEHEARRKKITAGCASHNPQSKEALANPLFSLEHDVIDGVHPTTGDVRWATPVGSSKGNYRSFALGTWAGCPAVVAAWNALTDDERAAAGPGTKLGGHVLGPLAACLKAGKHARSSSSGAPRVKRARVAPDDSEEAEADEISAITKALEAQGVPSTPALWQTALERPPAAANITLEQALIGIARAQLSDKPWDAFLKQMEASVRTEAKPWSEWKKLVDDTSPMEARAVVSIAVHAIMTVTRKAQEQLDAVRAECDVCLRRAEDAASEKKMAMEMLKNKLAETQRQLRDAKAAADAKQASASTTLTSAAAASTPSKSNPKKRAKPDSTPAPESSSSSQPEKKTDASSSESIADTLPEL